MTMQPTPATSAAHPDDADRQLAQLCATSQTYTTRAGESIEIAPIRVRQLAAVVRAAQPVMGALAQLATQPVAQQGGAVAALLIHQLDDVLALLAALTGRPTAWVEELELDDLAGIAGLALEVNADFFVHRLRPAIETLGETMKRSLGALGNPGQPDGSMPQPG